MEGDPLIKLLEQIDQKGNFNLYLKAMEESFLIKMYNITTLKTNNIEEMYANLCKKFYLRRKSKIEDFWYENQLRIFIYVLLGYAYVHQSQVYSLKAQDWSHLSTIFNHRDPYFFQFQALLINKAKSKPRPWCQDQTTILESIINSKKRKNQWNSIARQLFVRSGRRFFRNPKQCRQRWMNHLDPLKIHTEWTINQDIILLSTVKEKGKKWSAAVKELRGTRTEHMVKNRYKSLITNERKKHAQKSEAELQKIILKRLLKVQEKTSKTVLGSLQDREQVRSVDLHEHPLLMAQLKESLIKEEHVDQDRVDHQMGSGSSHQRQDVLVPQKIDSRAININEDLSNSIGFGLYGDFSIEESESLIRF